MRRFGILLSVGFVWLSGRLIAAEQKYQPPASPRAIYNFNPGWKFSFGDAAGAEQPAFDDSAWTSVSLPHTWNETDTYRAYISHSGGDQSEKMFGVGWYRKHFKLPASAAGPKVFIEFQGLRQAGRFFLNGQPVGKHENGITAVGLDVSKVAKFGEEENILAVKVDNSPGYKEEATGTAFLWNSKDFNPNFGGLNRDARLIVAGKIYQTLPLYDNLKTSGIYVYPEAIDLKKQTADLKVEAEVANEGDAPMPFGLGFHPYFPRTPKTRLTAKVEGMWLADDTMVTTNHVDGSPLVDLVHGALLWQAPFVDNCFTGWRQPAIIEQPDLGLSITLSGSDTFRFFHAYIPDGQTFFCAEPITAMPNAFNRPEAASVTGSRVLASGESFAVEMRIGVSRN